MKKAIYLLLTAAVLASCAKAKTEGASTNDKLALDAYMAKYYPDAKQTGLGVYILEDDNKGTISADSSYIRVEYTLMDRALNVTSSTLESENLKKNGIAFEKRNYYGPVVWYRGTKDSRTNLSVGIEQTIKDMKVGQTRTVMIPGWLLNTSRYDTEEEYVKNCSGTTVAYRIKIAEAFDDIVKWENDSLTRYMAANYPDAKRDTITVGTNKYWLYYIRTKDPISENAFTADSTIYCNYTLYRLDGTMVDTSVEQVALDNMVYNGSSYGPKSITWNDDYAKITMGSSSSSVVTGFGYAFKKMHQYESGKIFFVSGLGYSYSGSGSKIPAYCPLHFDIDLVKKP